MDRSELFKIKMGLELDRFAEGIDTARKNYLLDKLSNTFRYYERHGDSHLIPKAGKHEYHLNFFRKYLGANALVLDVGCANGRDCIYLDEVGLRFVGLDISRKLLDIAHRNIKKQNIANGLLVEGSICALPFVDGCFDGVWCCTVLHHLPHELHRRAIQEMHRVVRKGGIVFIDVRDYEHPRLQNLSNRYYQEARAAQEPAAQCEMIEDGRYYCCFSHLRLSKLLQDADFDIIEIDDPSPQNDKFHALASRSNRFGF